MAKTNFLLEHEINMQMFVAEIFVGDFKYRGDCTDAIEVTQL